MVANPRAPERFPKDVSRRFEGMPSDATLRPFLGFLVPLLLFHQVRFRVRRRVCPDPFFIPRIGIKFLSLFFRRILNVSIRLHKANIHPFRRARVLIFRFSAPWQKHGRFGRKEAPQEKGSTRPEAGESALSQLSVFRNRWSGLIRNLKKMPNLIAEEEKPQCLNAQYKIPSDSKLFIVLLAAVVMLPSLSVDSCLASLSNIGFSLHAQPAATAMILSLFLLALRSAKSFSDLCVIAWAADRRF